MLLRSFLIIVSVVLLSGVARATHTVVVPDYPTLAQLESGWNAAFVSWLTVQYGGTPVITSTVTYSGQEGQLFVVSKFIAGSVSGSILGRAFDPYEGTSLGGGEYLYDVASGAGFICVPILDCLDCEGRETRFPDGSYERVCSCILVNTEGEWESKASCSLTTYGDFTGSYKLVPGDYGTLPVLD